MKKTEEKVRLFISQQRLLSERTRVVVGVSGGPDSVCLAILLQKLGYEVIVVHCNFHLRGDESMNDEKFVKDLCNRLALPYYKVDFDTENYAVQHKISIEMAARELRYTEFRNIKEKYGARAIAVGHHQDDNAETMMLNLVRGTGIKGLCGIQPRNGDIVRPLLCLTRREVLAYLQEEGVGYVTDCTNSEDIYARNKVRLKVMPLFDSINQGALQNITSTIENLNEVLKVYKKAMEEASQDCCQHKENGELHIIISKLKQLPSPISLLHEILSPLGFNKKQLKDILSSLDVEVSVHTNNTGRMYEASGRRLLIDRGIIIVEGTNYFPTDIHKEIIPIDQLVINKSPNYAYIDADKLHSPLTMRTPKEGDSFAPFGMKGRRRLVSDFLTDLKLNRFEKEKQPLLTDGNEIVWVVNRRSSELYKVDKNTKRVLVLVNHSSTAQSKG